MQEFACKIFAQLSKSNRQFSTLTERARNGNNIFHLMNFHNSAHQLAVGGIPSQREQYPTAHRHFN